jgi:methyl-accepting chemotaxis protein
MEKQIKKEVRALNLQMELITYLGAVPFAVFFLVIGLKIYYEKFIYFLIATLVAVFWTLVVFLFLRVKVFYSLLNPVLASGNPKEVSQHKERLLSFPNKCGIMVQFQWLFGLTTVVLVYNSFVPIGLWGVGVFVLLYSFLVPINFMIHSTLADNFLSKILVLPQIKEIEIDITKIQTMTIFQRVGLTSFASLFLPFGLLITLYFLGSLSGSEDPFRHYLIALMGLQALILSFICATLLAKILRKNIENLKNGLRELKDGNLTYKMSLVDREELSFVMALDFNGLRDRILGVVTNLKNTSDKLNLLSLELEGNSVKVSEEAEMQSSFAEELSASMAQFQSSLSRTEEKTEIQKGLTENCATSLIGLEQEIQSNRKQANESSNLSRNANKFAILGAELGHAAETAISEIQEESKAITEYAQLISEISDQVGLLSLNASIESARAGEAGKGFQVVAREISKLGENTNANSGLISKKIFQLSKKIKLGYEKIQEVSKQFQEIQDASLKTNQSMELITENMGRQFQVQEKVKNLVLDLQVQAEAIRNSSREQNITIAESNSGLEKLTISSEQLAESARNLQNVSKELKSDASVLLKQIEFFKI